MALTPGTRLGAYEIVAPLGAGGMGEVYRARDTKLNRDVALKVLPDSFVHDSERVARFRREAQVLASLNHPHIGGIYGLEDANGITALVLELVEGPTLADRIAQGPIPLEEALPIAKQIAEALEAAHEQGIIHRDLKPANIKVRPDGTVKVLDFGLAKLALAPDSGLQASDATRSPTISTPAPFDWRSGRPEQGRGPMTQPGMILGTAAYMSPEQAKGGTVDKRTDIWAFGCVLYEMLTGKRAFEGEHIAEVLASVLARPLDLRALPRDLGPSVRVLIARCLEKDRTRRLEDMSIASFLLDEPLHEGPVDAPPRFAAWRFGWLGGLVVVAATGGLIATYLLRQQPAPSRPVRFVIDAPDKTTFVTAGRMGTSAAISPDGSRVAFTARDSTGKVQLWLRKLDDVMPQVVPGTDGANFPFWSPDSRSIGYFAAAGLQRIDLSSGSSQTVCSITGTARGGTWSPTGVIVFGIAGGSLWRVAATGGEPMALPVSQYQPDNRFPSFLPDGRHFLFSGGSALGIPGRVYLGSIEGAEPKRLISDSTTGAVYAPGGYLLFARGAILFAQAIDPTTFELRGDEMPVAEHIETGAYSGMLSFSVSQDGALVYGTGAARSGVLQLVWFDRTGKVLGTVGPAGNYLGLDLSPDGKRVAVHRHEGLADGSGGDIWIIDLVRNAISRFTFNARFEQLSPAWSPDGARIAYGSDPNSEQGLYVKPSEGTLPEELLFKRPPNRIAIPGRLLPQSWTPDGRSIVYQDVSQETRQDLWVLPTVGDHIPVMYAGSPFNENFGQVSADGRWLAYQSDESGTQQIYVRRFPGGTGKSQISTTQGYYPRWRHDGKELFYMDAPAQGRMMAAPWNVSGEVGEAGSPRSLFDSDFALAPHPSPYQPYAVTADGQRFLIPRPPATVAADTDAAPIVVVQDWRTLLRK